MDDASRLYINKWIHLVAIFLVLVGGLNWLSAVFLKKDAVSLFLGNGIITKSIYLLVGLSALTLFFKRDSYLPFLGETVLPCAAFSPRRPDNANKEITITTLPNTKVIYWASEPKESTSNEINRWDVAYNNYTNSGVAVSDNNGKAVLHFRGNPQSYKVPLKGVLKPHVHFRICEKNGIVGPVQIYYLENGMIEKFTL
jgi:uncharacterized membrane protein YuzA (DUF378 family)